MTVPRLHYWWFGFVRDVAVILQRDEPTLANIREQRLQISLQLRFLNLVFIEQGVINGGQICTLSNQMPDTAAHRIQTEVALAFQIQYYRLAREFLGYHFWGHSNDLIQVHLPTR